MVSLQNHLTELISHHYLRAEQHDEFHDGVAGLEGRDGLPLHEQVLAVRAHQCLGEEWRKVHLANEGEVTTVNSA